MRAQVMEAMAAALVDELGLEKTLDVLRRAERNQGDGKRSPDFIGMEGYAKMYAEEIKNEGRN